MQNITYLTQTRLIPASSFPSSPPLHISRLVSMAVARQQVIDLTGNLCRLISFPPIGLAHGSGDRHAPFPRNQPVFAEHGNHPTHHLRVLSAQPKVETRTRSWTGQVRVCSLTPRAVDVDLLRSATTTREWPLSAARVADCGERSHGVQGECARARALSVHRFENQRRKSGCKFSDWSSK